MWSKINICNNLYWICRVCQYYWVFCHDRNWALFEFLMLCFRLQVHRSSLITELLQQTKKKISRRRTTGGAISQSTQRGAVSRPTPPITPQPSNRVQPQSTTAATPSNNLKRSASMESDEIKTADNDGGIRVSAHTFTPASMYYLVLLTHLVIGWSMKK